MTASVVAAVAKGSSSTSITGIANQRVKECNRIEAMVTELAKFGVPANELPDGIEIHGIDIEDLKTPEISKEVFPPMMIIEWLCHFHYWQVCVKNPF